MNSRAPKVLVIIHDVDDNLNELAGPIADTGIQIVSWDAAHDHDGRPALEQLGEFDGVIALGAQAGVLEEADHAWMPYERKIMEWALETETPLLGLCFGSQLLASVAGGRVYVADQGEFGWTRVEMSPEAAADPVLGALGANPLAFHYHYDTFDLPQSATLLGTTGNLKQAYRVGNKAWATQFHPEVGLAQQLGWLTTYRRGFEREGVSVDEQVALCHQNWKAYRDQAWALAAAFAKQVVEHSQSRAR